MTLPSTHVLVRWKESLVSKVSTLNAKIVTRETLTTSAFALCNWTAMYKFEVDETNLVQLRDADKEFNLTAGQYITRLL
jgi:hypothetical protein